MVPLLVFFVSAIYKESGGSVRRGDAHMRRGNCVEFLVRRLYYVAFQVLKDDTHWLLFVVPIVYHKNFVVAVRHR